jgi:hypothetical protein
MSPSIKIYQGLVDILDDNYYLEERALEIYSGPCSYEISAPQFGEDENGCLTFCKDHLYFSLEAQPVRCSQTFVMTVPTEMAWCYNPQDHSLLH